MNVMEEILRLEAVDCGIIRQNFYTVLSGVCGSAT